MTAELPLSRKRVYGTLDGLRGVAAISVVVLHAPALFGVAGAPSAGLAVDLFFVMSGFIIGHAYEEKMHAGMSSGRFIAVRLIRLYPLFLAGLALGVMEALAETLFGRTQAWTFDQIATAAGAGLLMLPAPPGEILAAPAFRLNPPSWSLLFEVLVNIAYGLFLPRLTNRVLIWTIALAAVGLMAVAVFLGDLQVGSYWDTLPLGILRVTYSFFLGVLIYRYRDRLALPAVHPLIILALAAAIFIAAPGKGAVWFEPLCVLVLLPALVVFGTVTEPGPRLTPAFKFLGETSYAIYSLHYPVLLASQGLLRRFAGEDYTNVLAPWPGFVVVAMIIWGAFLIDRLYDTPVRRRLTQMLGAPAAIRARTL
jgi:peptidoglycan/LPS O-acetylase OafA/YrhL